MTETGQKILGGGVFPGVDYSQEEIQRLYKGTEEARRAWAKKELGGDPNFSTLGFQYWCSWEPLTEVQADALDEPVWMLAEAKESAEAWGERSELMFKKFGAKAFRP